MKKKISEKKKSAMSRKGKASETKPKRVNPVRRWLRHAVWEFNSWNPFSYKWESWKLHYPEKHRDGYYMLARREGSVTASERLMIYNFVARFVPFTVWFHFFNWYAFSKIGRYLNK
jgi:hypothetical protein